MRVTVSNSRRFVWKASLGRKSLAWCRCFPGVRSPVEGGVRHPRHLWRWGETGPLRDSATGPTTVSGGPLRDSATGPTTVGGGLPPSLQAPVCCIDVIMGEKRLGGATEVISSEGGKKVPGPLGCPCSPVGLTMTKPGLPVYLVTAGPLL